MGCMKRDTDGMALALGGRTERVVAIAALVYIR